MAGDMQLPGMPGSSPRGKDVLMALKFAPHGGDGAQLLPLHPTTIPCGFPAFRNLEAYINKAILQRS